VGHPLPIPGCYWVEPGRLLAGEYPGAWDAAEAAARLRRFCSCGIELFVDLTEEHEVEPYDHLLDGARHERRPIADFGTATNADYRATLDAIDEALAGDVRVYVHCRGGLGRTGTVVGCWLVRHGKDGGDAVARIASLRRGTPHATSPSPETPEQRGVIAGWHRGD
jgi:protein-tyrosine phosphatase